MNDNVFFQNNLPRRYILQYPKNGFWLVKKPMDINSIVAVPLHKLAENPQKEVETQYYRVGRCRTSLNGFFYVEALPLFQSLKKN